MAHVMNPKTRQEIGVQPAFLVAELRALSPGEVPTEIERLQQSNVVGIDVFPPKGVGSKGGHEVRWLNG